MNLKNLMIVLLLLSTLLIADDVLLKESASKSVLVPQANIAQTWRTDLDFDDSDWLPCSGAPGGVGYETNSGYENLISLDVSEYMRDEDNNPNASCYVRIKFSVTSEQIQNIDLLKLLMRYDDGFVAYLNGIKVAEGNAPSTLVWNSTADGSHEASGQDAFNISDFKSELKTGNNLLAIHGLNTSLTSSDFIINASLVSAEDPFKDYSSSNLPIIVIDTDNVKIPDEPKITAHMGIINNGDGQRNNLNDPFNEYDGFIGIEMRGYSSQSWPKKPYGFETRTDTGENNNVELFGMPSENDWVLHAPYVDKTLMRNVLIYHLAREMGWWAPRTQYCELFLNGEYQGVYVLVEKLKQDKNRLDIEEPNAENLTGGYILEMTLDGRVRDDETSFTARRSKKPLVVKYPKPEFITDEQTAWITDFYNEFEDVLYGSDFADPINGYPNYIDVPSFIDHMILAEAFNQLDAFSHSQHFYKRQDGKLFMGPAWDYNRTMGNASYFTVWATNEWWLLEPRGGTRAAYANKLMADPVFMQAYEKRWTELRQSILSFEHIYSLIDYWVALLEEARIRNFARWPVLGVSVSHKVVFDTYEEEVDYMKNWVYEKFTWLDEQFVDTWAGTVESREDYQNFEMPEQSGQFIAEFDMRANVAAMNGVTGLADIATGCDEYSDLACIVRFNPEGLIDARNGSDYVYDTEIPYDAGDEFHVRIVGDVTTHKYDVYITPKHGSTIQLASNYNFRDEQSNVKRLDRYVIKSQESSHNIKDFTIYELSDWSDSQKSRPDFDNYVMPSQTEQFTAEFDMRANTSKMDGVTGLANSATNCDAYSDLACIVRFNPDGYIDVRDGSVYTSDVQLGYDVGDEFHVRMHVDISTKKYSVFITPVGDNQIVLAENYDFRSDQSSVSKLDRYVLMAQVPSHEIKNFVITTETNVLDEESIPPSQFSLEQNYPNPFNPTTTISFSLPQTSFVELSIYNQRGQLVRTLYSDTKQAGEHLINWDGRDTNGSPVSSGIFLYRMRTDKFEKTKKMMLLR